MITFKQFIESTQTNPYRNFLEKVEEFTQQQADRGSTHFSLPQNILDSFDQFNGQERRKLISHLLGYSIDRHQHILQVNPSPTDRIRPELLANITYIIVQTLDDRHAQLPF